MPELLAKNIWIKPARYCTSASMYIRVWLKHCMQINKMIEVRPSGNVSMESVFLKPRVSINQVFHFQFQKQCGGYRLQYTYFFSLVARTTSLPKPNGGDSEVPLQLLHNNDHYYQTHSTHKTLCLTKINSSHNTLAEGCVLCAGTGEVLPPPATGMKGRRSIGRERKG